MAIKIIKSVKKEIAIYSAKCSNCNCEFEFNKEDAFFGEYGESKYLTINCPHCKAKIQSLNVNPCRYDNVENTKEVHNMKTAQEFREIAIKKMSTSDMMEAARIIETFIFDAISEGKNYISLNKASVTYKGLCDLTKGYDNLKTYLELHGYTVDTSFFDGSGFLMVSF